MLRDPLLQEKNRPVRSMTPSVALTHPQPSLKRIAQAFPPQALRGARTYRRPIALAVRQLTPTRSNATARDSPAIVIEAKQPAAASA